MDTWRFRDAAIEAKASKQTIKTKHEDIVWSIYARDQNQDQFAK